MRGKHLPLVVSGLLVLFLMAVVLAGARGFPSAPPSAAAQGTPGSTMEQRLAQILAVLERGENCKAVEAVLDSGLEILYGGLRPLKSKGLEELTQRADQLVGEAEMRLTRALEAYSAGGKCPELQNRVLDLKLFIEQMNEVAQAVGAITLRCGEGDNIAQPPCDELQALLDEDTGREIPLITPQQTIIRPSYSVKLRGPYVPPWVKRWEEDVRVTDPIGRGQCVVVFKETRGLMLRLHFHRIIVVTDPWVTTFGVPRGTRIPIWTISWVPSEYVKEWNICNPEGTGIVKTVTQRVVQDRPLEFFWRHYPKDP